MLIRLTLSVLSFGLVGGFVGCASEPTPVVRIPDYTSAAKAEDQRALESSRTALAARGISFQKEGRRWELSYPQNRPLSADERTLLSELVSRSDLFLNRYNRDHRIAGQLLQAKPSETNQIRQERTLARRLLDKNAQASEVEKPRASEAFLKRSAEALDED